MNTMSQTTDPFKETITAHLQEIAQTDELFVKTLLKPNKNIDDCVTYILNQVKKSGRAGFEDMEIFNMAIHYYDEDEIAIGNSITAKVVVNQPLAAPLQKTNDTIKSKGTDTNQTSLFNSY
jgi:hypothetical protein